MACGRAVVATDAGDVPDIVEEGQTGFVVPRGDDKRLADRVVTLILHRSLCDRMGVAARKKAEADFTTNRVVGETLGFYEAAGWKGR